jgi:hypothetical protein
VTVTALSVSGAVPFEVDHCQINESAKTMKYLGREDEAAEHMCDIQKVRDTRRRMYAAGKIGRDKLCAADIVENWQPSQYKATESQPTVRRVAVAGVTADRAPQYPVEAP